VFTFENVTAHNWGDTFFFIDRYQVQGDSGNADSTYGEFAPRLSLSWLSGQDLGFGPVNDVYLATQYEFDGGVEANNHMYGLGLGWDIPGFQYFNTNAYYVENNTAFDTPDDWQLTVTWGVPFELGSAAFLFDGFIDYSSGVSGAQSADLHINPQFKLDLGHFTGEAGVLYAGIEYSYWRNKFGSPNIDTENAVSALVKFHF
jgi:nucleoside-specific outer membrane channel protein Tsx